MSDNIQNMLIEMQLESITWNTVGVDTRGELLTQWAELLSTSNILTVDKLKIDENTKLLASKMVNYQVKHAVRLLKEEKVMPGPTGEINTLSLFGRGIFVITSDEDLPLFALVGFISCALISGNSVVLALPHQQVLIDSLHVSLEAAGLNKAIINSIGDDELETLIADPLVAGVVFVGSMRRAVDVNKILAEREGQIAPLILETDLQHFPVLNDSYLLLRFITEKTKTINVTAIGGNANLLALGCGD